MIALALCALGAAASHARAAGQSAKQARAIPKTKSPANGQTVSGQVKWRVRVRGARPKRVHFKVDGRVKVRRARHRRRETAIIDTTELANGSHTLTAIAYRSDGSRAGKSKVRVTVANLANGPVSAANGPGSVLWGAQIGDHLTGTQAPWDMNAVSQLEGLANRQLSMIHFASPFANCASQPCSYYPFPATMMDTVRQHGSIPFFSWASQSIPSSLSEPDFQLSDVIAGTYDSYIHSFATAAKTWGHPFFLRFNFEMNGDWFPWSERTNGNQPGEYVAAWRHVHDIFTAVGAGNASWVWCPNIDPSDDMQDLGSLYPGDGYVDWTCLDGYNWGTNPSGPKGWMSFDELYSSTYHEIADTIAPSKPMIIGEMGSSEYGGSKAAWIEDALTKIPAYAKIRGMLWFEKYDDGMDWPIETSGSAAAAFATGIQNTAYTSNGFANLSGGKVQPPGS